MFGIMLYVDGRDMDCFALTLELYGIYMTRTAALVDLRPAVVSVGAALCVSERSTSSGAAAIASGSVRRCVRLGTCCLYLFAPFRRR